MTTAAEPDTTGDELARAKPPFLKRVRIRNYKSIEFCDVSLEPLTLFVGRNASGKSNFLDALGFLSDLMDVSASEAVERRNGWNCVHFRGDTTGELEFYLEFSLELPAPRDVRYWVTLREDARTHEVLVESERLSLVPPLSFDAFLDLLDPQHPGWMDLRKTVGIPVSDRLLIGNLGLQACHDVWAALRRARVYNFTPAVMRHPIPVTGRSALSSNGENLARNLRALEELQPNVLERVTRYLTHIVPELRRVSSARIGSDYLTIQAEFQTTSAVFEAASLSDGTLRALAALVAVSPDHLFAIQAPGFVAIEEPETALHPAAMRALVDALDEATLRTQVLLTTHSADMLDNPTIRPENVRVVQMIDGRTVIAPVDAASVEIVRRDLDTLGGLERQDQLEPNADDVERQARLSRNGLEQKP